MTLVEAVLGPVVAGAAAAGVRPSIEGERKDRWRRWPFERLRLRLVAFPGLGVGCFGIRCLMPGIHGRAFAGCIFGMALSFQSISVPVMRGRVPYVYVFPRCQSPHLVADILEAVSCLF